MTVNVQFRREHMVVSRTASNAHASWSQRTWLDLYLHESGLAVPARGQAAPLPGYSRESLDECVAALRKLPWDRLASPTPTDPEQLLLRLGQVDAEVRPAAGRFAAHTALLELWSLRLKRPAWALLSAGSAQGLAIASWLQGPPSSWSDDAHGALERGVGTLKVKLTRPQDLDAITELRAYIGAGTRLRIDANQSLDATTAHPVLDALAHLTPEFVEEPVAPDQLRQLAPQVVPLALDESLQHPGTLADLPELIEAGVRVLVIKPMALGGITAAAAISRAAANHGLDVVFSHLLDGPVAFASTTALALAFGSRQLAQGLDRHLALGNAPVPWLTTSSLVPWDTPGLGLPWA